MVAAAVGKLPLKKYGIHIDMEGAGFSFYWLKKPGDVGTDGEREATIIATWAGGIAHRKFDPESPCGDSGDRDEAIKLLEAMHPNDRASFNKTQDRLYEKSLSVVEQYWQAICALAGVLLSKEWTPPQPLVWSSPHQQKWMDSFEVAAILEEFHISISVK